MIAAVAVALKDGADSVAVTGYADGKGTPERNRKIAAERARAVRDALLAQGISGERVRLVEPPDAVGDGSPAQARRVEIAQVAAGN